MNLSINQYSFEDQHLAGLLSNFLDDIFTEFPQDHPVMRASSFYLVDSDYLEDRCGEARLLVLFHCPPRVWRESFVSRIAPKTIPQSVFNLAYPDRYFCLSFSLFQDVKDRLCVASAYVDFDFVSFKLPVRNLWKYLSLIPLPNNDLMQVCTNYEADRRIKVPHNIVHDLMQNYISSNHNEDYYENIPFLSKMTYLLLKYLPYKQLNDIDGLPFGLWGEEPFVNLLECAKSSNDFDTYAYSIIKKERNALSFYAMYHLLSVWDKNPDIWDKIPARQKTSSSLFLPGHWYVSHTKPVWTPKVSTHLDHYVHDERSAFLLTLGTQKLYSYQPKALLQNA